MQKVASPCYKCNGKGFLSFCAISRTWRCFACCGTGEPTGKRPPKIAEKIELPEAERCTIKQLDEIARLVVKTGSEMRMGVLAGVPEVQAMDDWRYEMSHQQASSIIEYGQRIRGSNIRNHPFRIHEDLQRWTDAALESDLHELVMRFRWLCAKELHASNAYSYATLECWRGKAYAAIRSAGLANEREAERSDFAARIAPARMRTRPTMFDPRL